MLDHSFLLAVTFIGIVLVSVPLAFHIQHRNIAVISLCLWLAVYNAITFINGIIWNGPMTETSATGEGYCDISVRVQLVSQAALLGCAIAILRFLATVLSSKTIVATTSREKTRQVMIELCLIFTVPCIILAIQPIVYRNPRYVITSFYGCSLSVVTPNSRYMLLLTIWSPLLSIASIFYAFSIIFILYRRWHDFREVLRSSNSGLDVSRFLRLLSLALLAIFVISPVVIYQFYGQLQHLSFTNTKRPSGNFSDILFLYDEATGKQLWAQWFSALIALTFAGLFGLGREAQTNYRRWLNQVPGARVIVQASQHLASRLSGRSHARRDRADYQMQESKDGQFGKVTSSSPNLNLKNKSILTTKMISSPILLPTGDLARGHNHTELGTSSCKIWQERTDLPASPNKIKVKQVLIQESELR